MEIAEEHLSGGAVRALVINSGNANAATGGAGREDALAIWQPCRAHCPANEVRGYGVEDEGCQMEEEGPAAARPEQEPGK